ncbi:MAG: hypothetical protein JSV43_06305 [Methanobacteriota archaeon]|nr:MAG: hypothetical protein JSV43_06305 [Euryarchaeota archaeon]
MDTYTKWMIVQNEIESNRGSSEGDDPSGFAYEDGPFPLTNDDGSYLASGSDSEPCWPSEDCFVSDKMMYPPNRLGEFSANPHQTAGNFVVGDRHESDIGDQNGNGVLEWVVMYLYIPQMVDGIDNDGDGCIDEPGTSRYWGIPCNNSLPDAAFVYETGGMPIAGGDNGDLLVNIDWYSSAFTIKIFRAFVSSPFQAYSVRGFVRNPQIAGEFISYYAREKDNYVNSNPEMDDDLADQYVGNIDARFFPYMTPKNHVCSAGTMDGSFSTWKRDDGYVVTSYELFEPYDNHDWNGDGDALDRVVAYYAVGPTSGNCRNNVVNTGVSGIYSRNAGTVLTPAFTYEWNDGRDWNQNGHLYEHTRLYHDIDSTWHLKGRAYASITFRALIPAWGFGWWGRYIEMGYPWTFPLEFGGTYCKNLGFSRGYYHTYFFLISDEDGDRHTPLPEYWVNYGSSTGTVGGRCVLMYAREQYLQYGRIRLMGGIADGNGDGDLWDSMSSIFCPEEHGGSGTFIVDPSAKFAKGLYQDPYPALWEGYGWYGTYAEAGGYVTIPSISYSTCKCDYGPPPQYWCKTDQIYQLRWY